MRVGSGSGTPGSAGPAPCGRRGSGAALSAPSGRGGGFSAVGCGGQPLTGLPQPCEVCVARAAAKGRVRAAARTPCPPVPPAAGAPSCPRSTAGTLEALGGRRGRGQLGERRNSALPAVTKRSGLAGMVERHQNWGAGRVQLAAVLPGRRALNNVGVWTGLRSEEERWRFTIEL